jgi:hypothetical protein
MACYASIQQLSCLLLPLVSNMITSRQTPSNSRFSFAAKRLPYADHIISLGSDGRISEQGFFRELSSLGGYISSFNLSSPEWTYNPGYAEPPTSKQSLALPASIVPTQTTTDDATRRTGDVSVYLYYINAVGWLPSLVFVLAISSFVFCISFPGKIWCWNKHAPLR